MARLWTPYEEAQQQGRLWTPRLLSGIGAAWFDMSDLTRITVNSGTVSNVADAWGGAPYMQNASATTAPSFTRARRNGRYGAVFDKATCLLIEFYSATATMANAFTVVWVGSVNNAGSNPRALMWVRSAGGNDFDNSGSMALLYRSGANTLSTYQNGALRASSTVTDGTVNIITIESDGTTCRHYVNGVAGGSGAWGTISLAGGQFGIGTSNSGAGSTGYQGDWDEMIAVRAQGTPLRQRMEGAAAWKWGLQQKLRQHPYRDQPPLLGE